MKHPFRILLLQLSFLVAASAAPVAETVIVDANQLNGSFEKGLRPWVSRAQRDNSQHRAEAVAKPDAKDGARVLLLSTVNDGVKGNAASASLNVKKINLEKGAKFRLTWAARARAAGEFDRVAGRLMFQLADGTTVMAGRQYMGPITEQWSEHGHDVLYEGTGEVVGVTVTLALSRQFGSDRRECEGYIDAVFLTQMPGPVALKVPTTTRAVAEPIGEAPRNPIPVTFSLERAAQVTLVIEDGSGKRVRNLVSGESFPAGPNTVWWDGLDEGVPAQVPGSQSQRIERSPVPAGTYRVRGLKRDALTLAYDFTALPNVGNPPWPTELTDGKGGWLADHGTPAGVGYIPAALAPGGVEQMLLTSTVSESAQAVAWVDLQGNKLAGRRNLGGNWTGATHVVPDRGAKRNPDVYLYTHMPWTNKKGREIRLMGLTKEGALTAGRITHPFYDGAADKVAVAGDEETTSEADEGAQGATPLERGIEGGMAVHNGLLVYSLFGPDRLYFMDVRGLSVSQQGKPLGEAAVEKPHGLAFEKDGALLVLSGKRVLRYRVGAFPNPLSAPEVVIGDGLEEPRSLTVDNAGTLYIGDWGTSHQVKVFTREGKLVRMLGKPGVPKSGPVDAEKMNHPYGVAVTPGGQVWVTMRPWRMPKTVAVWKTDGSWERNFYGPTSYGGGGFLDTADPQRLLYSESNQGGVEFKLDWQTGRAEPSRVYWVSSETPVYQPKRWQGPMFPRRIGGAAYITNEFGGPTSGAKFLTIWKDVAPGGMKPVAFAGNAGDWAQLEDVLAARFPEWTDKPAKRFRFAQTLFVVWSDANGDGLRQDDEYEFRPLATEPGMGLIKSVALAGDSFTVLLTHENGVMELKPHRVENGVPYYRVADLNPVAAGLSQAKVRSTGRSQVLQAADDTLVVTGGPIMGVKNGEVKWTYHSQWPSLHIGHAAPRLPEYPGQLLATTRLLGPLVKPAKGEAGELWAINSDRGVIYLLTADGLFVDTLFAYPGAGERSSWNMPEATRGMDLAGVNAFGESFFPSINQMADGRIYLVAGKSHASLVRIDGLETVRRFEAAPVVIDAAAAGAIQSHRDAMTRREKVGRGGGTAQIARLARSPKIDGKLDDWPVVQWLPVGGGRITRGFSAKDVVWTSVALATDGAHLTVAVRTRQKNLLGNSGADPQLLFTTGGALDIQLATRPATGVGKEAKEGDVRLLVSLVNGKPLAVRYRPKVAGTVAPVVFETTVSHETIDRIDDVSDGVVVAVSRVKLDEIGGGLMGAGEFDQIEMSVPLSVLGWNIQALPVTRGDVGVLLGRPGTTLERVYWHNAATGLINDVPSEVKLQPHLWGEFRMQ